MRSIAALKIKRILLLILLTIIILLSACNLITANTTPPTPTPTPTLLPPLARVVDISPNAIVIPIPIDPPSFNAYINDTGYEELIGELVFGALAELDPTGNYYPELATEVPGPENGGLSPDGLTVTWHLRPGIFWSDGEPFTATDVVFTWEALRQSGIYAPGFDLITDIETPDETTVILHYREFYPNYRLQFGGEGVGIFPAHQCGDPDKMLRWDCNLKPVSIGPFVLAEWVPRERLIFNPNPNYWVPERPLAEQLIFVIEADEERRERMLQSGNAHLDLWTEEPQLSHLEEEEAVMVVDTNPARFILRLVPNLSAYGSADTAQPHPILADLKVRQAIRHAINVPQLIAEVFNNRAIPMDTELARNGCQVTPYRYNPETAKILLTQAGWIDQDDDGVRECHGCRYAAEGTPLKFDSYHYVEFGPDLAKAHRSIELMLFEAGIDMRPKPVEGFDLWGTWTDEGIEVRGNFNLDLWDDGYFGIDPTDYLYNLSDPRAIPTRNDPLAGFNVMRYRNPELTDIFDQLYTPIPEARRAERLCQLAVILYRDLPDIPLLAFPDYYAIHRRLQGVSAHIYDIITWNAADWYLLPEEK